MSRPRAWFSCVGAYPLTRSANDVDYHRLHSFQKSQATAAVGYWPKFDTTALPDAYGAVLSSATALGSAGGAAAWPCHRGSESFDNGGWEKNLLLSRGAESSV